MGPGPGLKGGGGHGCEGADVFFGVYLEAGVRFWGYFFAGQPSRTLTSFHQDVRSTFEARTTGAGVHTINLLDSHPTDLSYW